jgi:hypothetical protein
MFHKIEKIKGIRNSKNKLNYNMHVLESQLTTEKLIDREYINVILSSKKR